MKILMNLRKNFFFKIKLIVCFLLLIPVYIIMFCLRPFLIIRFGEIDLSRIGHSLNYELFSLYQNENQREIYIWFMSKKICNFQLYKMFKRNFFFFENLNIIIDTPQFFSDRFFYFLKKLIYEIDMYDSVMESGDRNAAFFAMQALSYKYGESVGVEGKLVQGKAPTETTKGFKSQAEVVNAMQDPRYDRDPAYRQEIMAKLERSNVNF